VRFGRESTDEMGSITLDMLAVREEDVPRHAAAVREHMRQSFLARFAAGRPGTGWTNSVKPLASLRTATSSIQDIRHH